MLLRRVVQAFGKKASDIRFIATSATIAGKDAEEKLRDYLAGLAGVEREQVDVIGGSRIWPDINSQQPRSISIDDIKSIDKNEDVSPERFIVLEQSDIATTLRHTVVSSNKPHDLNDLVDSISSKLIGKTKAEKQQEVLSWLDLLTGTRRYKDEPPFLKLRTHIFQRMLHGLWACVDSRCSAKSQNLKDWPFGNVYVSQRARCDCHAPVYELAFCNDCKAPHLVAEDRNGTLQQCSPYAGDEFSLTYEQNEEDSVEEDINLTSKTAGSGQSVILAGRATDLEQYETIELDVESLRLGSLAAARSTTIRRAYHKEGLCSACHASDNHYRTFLKKAYLGSPFYVANAVPTVLEFCPDPDKADCNGMSPEELPGRGRKLITFTDSRQGTARMAVRMQQEAERSKLRGLIFSNLKNAQISANKAPQNAPTADYDQLMANAAEMEELGMHAVAIPESVTSPLEKYLQHLSLQGM